MSTTSPNFNLVLATSADLVAVDSHLSNNFSTLDSVLAVLHTGTGQFKASVTIPTPILQSPVFSGTASGAGIVLASTGAFSTITATGGSLTINSLSVGTYGYPAIIGSTSAILTVVTGNAQWAAATPNTGANQALSNLTTVAFNTGIGTGSGGFFTFNRLNVSSGALTGLTTFQATTGTFAGSLVVTGTVTANAVNCTGGSITGASIGIGTYSMPSILGSTGQFLKVSASTLGFADATSTAIFSLINGGAATGQSSIIVSSFTVVYDPAGSATATGYTTPSSGVYFLVAGGGFKATGSALIQLSLVVAGTPYTFAQDAAATNFGGNPYTLNLIRAVTSGGLITMTAAGMISGTFIATGITLAGYKIPNM